MLSTEGFKHQRAPTTEPLMKNKPQQPSIALIPWGDAWEDFLDSINISLETFCAQLPAGWILGYVDSLGRAGVRTVLVLVSARVNHPTRTIHQPTGAIIVILPSPKGYRAARSQMKGPSPYIAGEGFNDVFGNPRGARLIWSKLLMKFYPYLSTPIAQLAKTIREEGCQAILCQEYESPRFDICVLLGRLIGVPVFASFQGRRSDPNSIGRLLRPLTIRLSHGLLIGSQTEIDRVRSRYHSKSLRIFKVFNPIDVSLWANTDHASARDKLGIPHDAQVVIWHGRIDIHSKGLDILLKAWEYICKDRDWQQLRLILVGTGNDAERMKALIASFPYSNIHWVDRYVSDRSEIQLYLSAADIYAFPSIYEGFPVAPLEAMACSLPLVASDASGIPDILEAGIHSGGLVVPRFDVEAFAEALESLIDNPELRKELALQARNRIEQSFSLEEVGKQLQGIVLSPAQ